MFAFAELVSVPILPPSRLLELPPQRKKELTFAALQRQLESLALRQPSRPIRRCLAAARSRRVPAIGRRMKGAAS
jgi:hypothetical protein